MKEAERVLRLSRLVPAHTRAVRFHWIKADFMVMSQQYRRIREKCRSPMDTCKWCGHKHVDGEMMALAGPEKGANWILCQRCATEAQAA